MVDIIFLNGTSSSGKTTVAEALRERLDGVWLHVTLDAVFRLMPAKFFENPSWGDELDWDAFLDGFHAMVAELPRTGFPVILDHVCTSHRWRNHCVKLLKDYRVLYVGVRCPLEELRRRETSRGDRKIGIAEEHLPKFLEAGPFDLEIDTSECGPAECAARIIAAADHPPRPTAFERIRRGL